MLIRPSAHRQRGAVLVHTAIAMVAVTAFSAVVIDFGLFWVSRRQSQNAADAGALAGAMSLAFEDTSNLGPTGLALVAARAAAGANAVWGERPDLVLADGDDSDVRVVDCPDGTVNNCVRVDVLRTSARGNPLPTFFARLVGVAAQDVRSTATAEALLASTSDAVKPWAVADRWDEVTETGVPHAPLWDPDWTPASTFLQGSDDYQPPTVAAPGTSYRIYDDAGRPCCDYGRVLSIKQRPAVGPPDLPASWYQEISFPGMDGSNADWVDAIMGGHAVTIGDTLTVGAAGAYRFSGDAIHHLIQMDPDAFWYNPQRDPLRPWLDTYNPRGIPVPEELAERCPEGCVYSPDTGINASPRIGAVAIVSPEDLAACPAGCSVAVRNVLGFFIDREVEVVAGAPQIYGRLVRRAGRVTQTALPVHQAVAGLRQIVLVR